MSQIPPLRCQEVSYETIDVSKETGIVGASSIKLNLPPFDDSQYPTVSIVVPTHNRQHFFSLILRNWERIDYPKELLELVILDDSDNVPPTAPTPELFANKPGINYTRIFPANKLTIGAKRNTLCRLAKHDYIVHMDDDDWYPKESVAARMRVLLEFEKATKAPGCVGCSKVLCMDLLTNQMFEAYDQSTEASLPATLSESTMAYSKAYCSSQGWDQNSTYAECIPFLNGRHATVCTLPSVFVVTQFTHGTNTIERRVEHNSVSEYNAIRFQGSLSAYDSQVFNKIRANVVRKLPAYREAIGFVQKAQSLTQSQLKKLIKKTRKDKKTRNILQNPLVIDFMRENLITKKTTSGRDIVYYCGPGDHFKFSNTWNPESKTLGGSEEAVIHLTTRWAAMGFNVTVYCALEGAPKVYNKVSYRNYWEWIPKNLQDVTVIWRDPSNCKHVMGYSKKVILDLHDALDPNWVKGLHKDVIMMTKSNYHKELLQIPNGIVVPNGIEPIGLSGKTKNVMICTSSPDRCLRALLRALPLIRTQVPDAEIHWAYGFKAGVSKGGMEAHGRKDVRDWVKESKELIDQTPGFKNLGRLTQGQVNKLYKKGDLFIYPTRFPEIDCISLSKAMSAGCIPIVTPAGAMAEKMGSNVNMANATNNGQVDTSLEDGDYFNQFVQAVVKALNAGDTLEQRQNFIIQANQKYNWDHIVAKWMQVISPGLPSKSRKRHHSEI